LYIIFRDILRSIFKRFNLGLIKHGDLVRLHQSFIDHTCLTNKLDYFMQFQKSEHFSEIRIPNFLEESKSQNGQDLFAIWATGFKREGVFIEFGGFDGVIFSNTYLLEKHFSWNGILIDPIPSHFESMKKNRECTVIQGAVSPSEKGAVLIEETPASELSGVVSRRRYFTKVHKVESFTLGQIIEQHLSHGQIDFLSIDVEGQDLEILKELDLEKYKIKAICVEHNFRKDSRFIIPHMIKYGYDHVFEDYSKNDYWFVLHD
jgi:FkbM family methyltransferase